MKHSLRLLVLLAGLGTANAHAQSTSAQAVRLIVRLQDNLRAELQQAGTSNARPATAAFEQLNQSHRALQVRHLNPGRSQARGAAEAPTMYLIELPAGTDTQQAVRAYEQTGLFRYVELDAAGQGAGVQGVAPNDALYSRQWGLKNDGSFTFSAARAGADIKMEDAWAITRGDSTVTVAIIDSGCKLDHPEFAGRIWRNRQEIANNGLDDDQNGYVDDVRGWNFVSATNDPTDDNGHGTNVVGIVGASGNNGLGYAGVNWGCKLMICKGLNAQNSGLYSAWTSGIYYAVDNGARVINMSMGGVSRSQAMQDAVTYANQRGVAVVVSMMNNNDAVVYYPAGATGVIAVGSTNPDDTRSNPFSWSPTSGSSYGPHISVVAPGNYIFGLNHQSNTNYNTYWGGTSQAAPHVTGLASLMLTLRPQLTPAQVKTILQNTADDRVGNFAEDAVGWDQYYGYGRINAPRALSAIVTSNVPAKATAAGLQLFPNPAHGAVTVRVTDTRLLQQDIQLFNGLGQLVSRQKLTGLTQQLPIPLAPGAYWLTVAGTAGGQQLLVE